MIAGTIQFDRFGFGLAEKDGVKIILIQDADSGLKIQLNLTPEDYERFATRMREGVIVQATKIPDVPTA